ncbi:tetratricopeptide repeat protein [Sphingomonas sp.]|uniref:tetratricopeptide repeat protein n=1 Tax=Sphingomonas sp. TaxID=28214 RepID=UPI0025F1E4A8|nr:tetratricopeptide repeat protein [Sphingomonas sp.]
MASTPPTNQAFLREVDDELRRDQFAGIWQSWGRWIIVAIVAALVALAGFLYWKSQEAEARGIEGEQLSGALDDLVAGKMQALIPRLNALAASKVPGYKAAGKLTLADIAAQQENGKSAAAQFGAVAADTSLAQPYRDLALIRQTASEYDTLKPEQVVARLKSLAIPGNPWFGSAGEMVGVAYMRMNKPDLAGATFKSIISDQQVPSTIRSRIVQLAAIYGVEETPAGARKPGDATGKDKN